MQTILAAWLAIATAGLPAPPPPSAVAAVPEEPGVIVLDEPATLQAVVADFQGASSPDVVRLVRGADGAVRLEVWRFGAGGWGSLGDGIEVREPPLERFDVPDDAGPVRLIARRVAEKDRVTLVRQPAFAGASLEPACCLELDDVVVADDGTVELTRVGSAPEAVDGLLALDMDGDGIDELLASRSLPPLGRTAYPSEAIVFRWTGDGFDPPVLSELPVGSGDTPFVLGETDGQPGDEAGIIATAAQSRLHRLVLEDGDRVRAESAVVASSVAAVALDTGPGVAIAGPRGVSVHRWPAGEELGPPLGERTDAGARLLGGPVGRDGPVLVAELAAATPSLVWSIPALDYEGGAAASGAAMRSITRSAVRPYRGLLPGGDANGIPTFWHDGVLTRDVPGPALVPALGDARPIGFAGPERSWLVVAHGLGAEMVGPSGGRLEPIGTPRAGSVAIVPADVALRPERDNGALEPATVDAVDLGDGMLGIAPAGFGVRIQAPPSSRAWAGLGEGATLLGAHLVPASGTLEIRLPLPRSVLPYQGDRAWIVVVSPAGATYTAVLDVLALTGPPPLEGTLRTTTGAAAVTVSGSTAAHASVAVNGTAVPVGDDGRFTLDIELPPWPTDVEIVATDPIGNEARLALVGSGFVDFAALPWLGIGTALVAVAAAVLFVRAPARRPRPAALHEDDGVLEELEPGSPDPET